MNFIVINNTDMIKIFRVMTVYTIKSFLCMCITSFYTYTTLYIYIYIMKYFIYVLQARYFLYIYRTCQQFILNK